MKALRPVLVASLSLVLASCQAGNCGSFMATVMELRSGDSSVCSVVHSLPEGDALSCVLDYLDQDHADYTSSPKAAYALSCLQRDLVSSAIAERWVALRSSRIARYGAVTMFIMSMQRLNDTAAPPLDIAVVPVLVQGLEDSTDIIGPNGRSDAPRYAADFAAVALEGWIEWESLPTALKDFTGYSGSYGELRDLHDSVAVWWRERQGHMRWDTELQHFADR